MRELSGSADVHGPVLHLPDVEAEPVFIVDDDEGVLDGMYRILTRLGYNARRFAGPGEALGQIREGMPKVMVTDLDMPGMTGLELAERAREIDPRIRVIMVTGAGDEEAAQAALRLGLSDYLTKPVDLGSLARAVQGAFMAHAGDEYALEMDQWLRDEVRRQTGVIEEVTLSTLESLLNALEARSPYFKGHSQSVAVCAAGIGRELGLPEQEVKSIRTAGLLHDIGMMAVPDAVVNKPGELDPHEYGTIVAHCRKGAEILEPMAHLGSAITFVLEHHERLDGTGYPDQKKGDEISLGGQIVGLAEAWTALIEQRSYRDRMRPADALATLLGAAGLWFSAELIDALRASET